MRHFDRLETFPERLLHVGDVVCSFDPVFGQGMASAALQVLSLGNLLAARQDNPDPLAGLERAFFTRIGKLVETPWQLAARSHFEAGQTRPVADSEYEKFIRHSKLAMEDPAVHRVLIEVFHLVPAYEELRAERSNAASRIRKIPGGV
jgi:2-polyprenyl-6-methoxyphenol hydroxylase-like FAD-dependent oxidoreductase